ncbi:hypothetical protein BpHYR1_039898 [Brachionus plicatilis]|uniref:Uncharacterized protein n=1 Tax=Brachionus plicatilis TaxID=10195 RepID=A0A3M7R300_BRAPC|nr:hypothetical protein BpHYR1_039898 [Brachionus plicatilis]
MRFVNEIQNKPINGTALKERYVRSNMINDDVLIHVGHENELDQDNLMPIFFMQYQITLKKEIGSHSKFFSFYHLGFLFKNQLLYYLIVLYTRLNFSLSETGTRPNEVVDSYDF